MKHNIITPSVGESITEVTLLKWARKEGQAVQVGDLILEIESDKATVELVAEFSGALSMLKQEGERVPIGEVIGFIDDAVQGTSVNQSDSQPKAKSETKPKSTPEMTQNPSTIATAGPATRKLIAEQGINPSQITGTGKDGRITQGDVIQYTSQARPTPTSSPPTSVAPTPAVRDGERRVPMTNIRAKIAERLVQAQHTAAILTTFNEADMGPIMTIRAQHKDSFKAKHGVALSFMSFFTRASIETLKIIPEINASVDGRDVIYHDYYDIGIAVGTDRGLVVPIVRNAGAMGFIEIEKKINELAVKARDSKLSIADMSGGTFTISNGGVYGSLLSTPILNPPQSGILGMHKIQDRPIVVNGKIEIRPMMYLALSYDHRLIDGKGAVTFLVTLKDYLEHPEKLNMEF